jgi:hypothetical protein
MLGASALPHPAPVGSTPPHSLRLEPLHASWLLLPLLCGDHLPQQQGAMRWQHACLSVQRHLLLQLLL